MALMSCNFFSSVLGYDTDVKVILPEAKWQFPLDENEKLEYKVLYLLHGMGDNSSGWGRYTSIERYALEKNIAIVMPTAGHSFYSDSVHGKKYFTFIAEELPILMKRWFPISKKPEDTFIAGVSMGGYGALKIGFTYPEKFAGMASLSGAVIINKLIENAFEESRKDITKIMEDVFGTTEPEGMDELLFLAKKNIAPMEKKPKILQYIGKEDFLYNMNMKFKEEIIKLNIPLIYDEWHGEHEWGFWDKAIKKAIDIFV